MKKNIQYVLIFSLVFSLLLLPALVKPAVGQWVDPPTQPTPAPWNWNPGSVIDPAQHPAPFAQGEQRPLLYISEYHTDNGTKSVNPYGTFGLKFTLANNGKEFANNIVMTFSSQDFDPLDGSVITFYEIDARLSGPDGSLESGNYVNATHIFKVNDLSTW